MQAVRQVLVYTFVPLAVASIFNGLFWVFYTYTRGLLR
jgi:hypothetical protein